MEQYLDIALIITSIALIISVILQGKGTGLGGLTGSDTGSVIYRQARDRKDVVLHNDWIECSYTSS